jgi:hypothetical protein
MGKMEHQDRLISGLKAFTGSVPSAYANQREFFFTSLNSMSEDLINLKKETLSEACNKFKEKLDGGKVTDITITEFKALLEKLVPDRDFKRVCASMVGSNELIKSRISSLEPISLIEEERERAGKDPEAERHIKDTYVRLGFSELTMKVTASPDESTAEAVLAKAREEVKEYCCLYHVPLNEEDTLTPFSLLHVDAVIAASYRLLSDIRRAMSAGM